MAKIGVSLSERVEHILKSDPCHPDNPASVAENDQPTVFYLSPLTLADRIEILDMQGHIVNTPEGATIKNNQNSQAVKIVQRACKGWDNYLDSDGKKIPFNLTRDFISGKKREILDETSLSCMAKEDMIELAKDIMYLNGMTGELEKKLEQAFLQSHGVASETGDVPKNAAPSFKEKEEAAQKQPNLDGIGQIEMETTKTGAPAAS